MEDLTATGNSKPSRANPVQPAPTKLPAPSWEKAAFSSVRQRPPAAETPRLAFSEITLVANAPLLKASINDAGEPDISVPIGGLSTAVKDCACLLDLQVKDIYGEQQGSTGLSAAQIRDALNNLAPAAASHLPIEPFGVTLERSLYQAFYTQVANGLLWPALHGMNDKITSVGEKGWDAYRRANALFAQETLRLASGPIWIHDYQLMLVPALVRENLGQSRPIGYFHHIPWATPEQLEAGLFRPQIKELVNGLLGSDLIGFHTKEYAGNFLACAEALKYPVSYANPMEPHLVGQVDVAGRQVTVGAYPIGLDADRVKSVADSVEAQYFEKFFRESFGRFPGKERQECLLLFGLERLDYTKGVLERFQAIDILLDKHPEMIGKLRLVQIESDTRLGLKSYSDYKQAVHEVAYAIDHKYSRENYRPIENFPLQLTTPMVYGFFRGCDAALVTPLRDGMNLVIMEAILSCREDAGFILGQGAGAAALLPETTLVNGADPTDIARGIWEVYQLRRDNPKLIKERYQHLTETVRRNSVKTWGLNFLTDLTKAAQPFRP